MKFRKVSAVLTAVLSIYILFFIYNMLDFIYISKRRDIQHVTRINFNGFPVISSRLSTAKRVPSMVLEKNGLTAKTRDSNLNEKTTNEMVLEQDNNIGAKTFSHLGTMKEYSSQPMIPYYNAYESMIMDDAVASTKRNYPSNVTCSYLGLRKPYITSSRVGKADHAPESSCRTKILTPKDCREAVKYYGRPGSLKEKNCSSNESIVLCSVIKEPTANQRKYFAISCDYSLCRGKTILVGLLNEATGMIDEKDWKPVPDIKHLQEVLRRHVTTSKFGSGFALLKCDGGDAMQVLKLPKILKRWYKTTKTRKRNGERININIVVEDSLSRAHFYRTLPKTISAFRKIVYDQSIAATVLEFEMVQSYASTTLKNIQRLFNGRKQVMTVDDWETYGIEEFFSKFKEQGYTTLFQEDNCWYDSWSTFLDPRQTLAGVKDEKTRTERWHSSVEVLKRTRLSDMIDDYGMSFLTCPAYHHLGTTNTFSAWNFPKVCINGRHFSSLHLEYLEDYASAHDSADRPFLSYTHLVTSHESSGKRIVNDDAKLASLFLSAASLRNTLTIFASDHGGKTTSYSVYTTQGHQEVFQPLLFMIVPLEVRNKLGTQIMDSLVVNQKRLLGLQDLHDALLSLPHMRPADFGPSSSSERTGHGGLFQPLPLNRTCNELFLGSEALCLCEGMDKMVSNTSIAVLWSAEYALGTLNNKIQDQYVQSFRKRSEDYTKYNGYGACQRYLGLGIERARQVISGESQSLRFSLLVKPFHFDSVEVFDAHVVFSGNVENGITLKDLIRVSAFNGYEECADKGVNPRLCACRNNANISRWQSEFVLKVRAEKSFSLEPKTQVLDYPCLTVISRSHKRIVHPNYLQDRVVTYEALNACALVTYNLTVDIWDAVQTQLSSTEPFTVKLFPRTMTFLMTVRNEWKFGKVVPKFTFKRTMIEAEPG